MLMNFSWYSAASPDSCGFFFFSSFLLKDQEGDSRKYLFVYFCSKLCIHSLVKMRRHALGLFFFLTRRFKLCALNSGAECHSIYFEHHCFGKSAATYALHKCQT